MPQLSCRPALRHRPLLLLLLLLPACGPNDKPLDADTRQAIDSTATAQINALRGELDTLCRQRKAAELPHLVDSIKAHRMREIEEQLKTIPK